MTGASRAMLGAGQRLTTGDMSNAGSGTPEIGGDAAFTLTRHPTAHPAFKHRLLHTRFLEFRAERMASAEHMDDTMTILSSEILMADLACYQSVREAARRGLPGVQQIHEDLRPRLPDSSGRPVDS